MAGRVRGGRPWGPIRADSTEARELAEFLREQVDFSGRTLTQLAGQMHVSKSQISVGLAGKVPEPAFVTALIHATIPEPRLREKRLAQAGQLLDAAARPSPASPAPPAASMVELAGLRAQQVETYDRLTRSLEAQNQLHEAAGNSAKLVMVLLTMINRLERRITDLTGERDQLRAAHVDTNTLHQTQQQLTRAQEQEQRAQQELARAQEKQRQAETLAATVQAQVAHLTDELDRLRSSTGTDAGTGEPENILASFTTSAGTTTDPVGDDFDQALTRITAVNDHDDQLLHDITHNLQQDPGQDEDADSWWVVQDNPPDNPPAIPDTADNLTGRQQAAEAADTGGAYPTPLRGSSVRGRTDPSPAYDDLPYATGEAVDRADVGGLVRSAADGDAASWKALVEGLSPLVWSVVHAHRLPDADGHEVYQTVWFRFAQDMRRIREPDKVGSWLASTARHECLKVLKRLRRLTPTGDPQLLDQVSEDSTPEQSLRIAEEAAAGAERIRAMWEEFDQLGEKCKQLLRILVASPQASYEEVSTALGIAVDSIEPLRQRCLRRLRARIDARDVDVGSRSGRGVAGGPEQFVPLETVTFPDADTGAQGHLM